MENLTRKLKKTVYVLPCAAAALVLLANALPFCFGAGALTLLFVTIPASLAIAWAGGMAGWALFNGGDVVQDELRRVKNCQQILYLTAGVGAAILGIGFSSGGGGTVCSTEEQTIICQAMADPPETTCLELVGLVYLLCGACALVLEPWRHELESEVENTSERPASSI